MTQLCSRAGRVIHRKYAVPESEKRFEGQACTTDQSRLKAMLLQHLVSERIPGTNGKAGLSDPRQVLCAAMHTGKKTEWVIPWNFVTLPVPAIHNIKQLLVRPLRQTVARNSHANRKQP